MPTRWLVDGMNVIGSRPDKWWNDPDRAMHSLTQALDEYAALTGDDVTVVFDRAPRTNPETTHAVVTAASRKGRNAADHEIVDLVNSVEDPSTLTVVTSDRRLRDQVQALGSRTVSSGRFRDHLDASTGEAGGS
ncbi:MAG: NYN domain-containing protein [Actinomycetota bacterium]